MLGTGSIELAAKRLAMRSNDWADSLAKAATGKQDYSAEESGVFIGLVAPIVEKAVLACSGLPADIAATLFGAYLSEYGESIRVASNGGGHSNFGQRAIFNARFHSSFKREYERRKPLVDDVWNLARRDGLDPLRLLAEVAVAWAQTGHRQHLQRDQGLTDATYSVTARIFREVRDSLLGISM